MNKTMQKVLVAGTLLFGASSVFAQSLTVPAQSGVINGAGQTFTVNFVSNNSDSMNFFLDTAAGITYTAVADSLAGLDCTVVNPTRVACIGTPPSGTFPDGTVTVTYTAGATAGPVAQTFSMVACTPVTCTATNGAITLNAGPSGPTLTYNPAGATAITVAASGSGTAVTSNIAVAAAGGDTGQTTTLACTITGAGFATPVVTGSPFAGGTTSTGNIGLACGSTATTGTLSCVETRLGTGGSTVTTTWPLTCASAPGFASTPPPGGTVNIAGIQGSTASGSIGLSNPGTAAVTVTGTIAGAAGITLGTITSPIAAGGTGVAPLSCAVPPTAGTSIQATVTLTASTTPVTTATYTINCLSQSASIPTLGFGGKALMVLLMLGFGLVGFQLYRRSA